MYNKTNKTVSGNSGINTSLKDALINTPYGQELIQIKRMKRQEIEKRTFEKKQQQELIVNRIRSFKSAVLKTFGYGVYTQVKPSVNERIKAMCIHGGEEYNRTMNMVNLAHSSKAAYNGAVTLVLTGK